ncbi:MAG TPA: outer membrane protein assembly factor BamA [Acidisarcina sp.]
MDPIFSSEDVLISSVITGGRPQDRSRHHQTRTLNLLLRRTSVTVAALVCFAAICPAWAQQPAPDTTQQQAVPQTQSAPQPLAAGAAPAAGAQPIVTAIRVIGNRRIPKETVLARLFSRQNDAYDPLTVERDFNSLWNTGYFEDVRIEREDTPQGVVLDIYVHEKPTIREINYKGLNSVQQSDVLEAFKKTKVPLSIESQYDATKVARAVTVLKELLAGHGHQFSVIKTEVKTIPPASVAITFNVKEGPKVEVGKIQFTGNTHISSLQLRRSMKNLRPVGIPHSLILENIFPRTFDASKLEEDAERVRQAYRDRGYFHANVGEPTTQIRNEGGLSLFTFRPRKGKRIDIRLPIEEGDRYRIGSITFSGNKTVNNNRALRAQFAMKDGDWFDYSLVGKGLENLRKAYGHLGYINFVGNPVPTVDEAKKVINLNIDIDEGKQFYVSRIEFQGNTVTRDFVIRRELNLEEGQVYDSNRWEQSLLRLNQLEYFEPLKVDQDSTATPDAENATVQLLLKVKEKGKNSIGLNGGLSGLSGSFVGLNYQTNNFLGLGETLSVQASLGNTSRNLLFGFTEPYFRNRPLNLGFQVFSNKTDYNAAKNSKLTGSDNISQAAQSLIQNYNQSATGLTFSGSYPIRRSFARVGVTYSLQRSSVTTFSQASSNLFQALAFRSGIQGSNALQGIVTSMLSFSYQYNRLDSSYRPRNGQEFSSALQVAGLFGNVRYISPVLEFKQFRAVRGLRFDREGRNVLGYKMQLAYIQGISGDVAPPFNRFYIGGESDIRGFDIRTGTPYAFIPTRVLFNLINPDGTTVPRDPANPGNGPIQVPIPVYGIVSVGGDTSFTSNVEYRIPVGGPVSLELFDDFGIDTAFRKSQLRESLQGFDALASPLYGCPVYANGACQGGVTGTSLGIGKFIHTVSGTNFVPRMSMGAQLSAILPIVNAPFRIYYAFNPLRLYHDVQGQELITRTMFPEGGAGDFSYGQAIQQYDRLYHLREPRKTFRLTVSTTF